MNQQPRTSNAPVSLVSRDVSIDLVKGLATLAMIHLHMVHAFGDYSAMHGVYYFFTAFIGGGAAPIFLTFAGLSSAIVWRRSPRVWVLLRRGGEIWLFGVLFRVIEWLFGLFDPQRILALENIQHIMRVDVLNCLGASMCLTALLLWALRGFKPRTQRAVLCALGLLVMAMTPFVPRMPWLPSLPEAVRYYFYGPRQLSSFPLFGWLGMTLMGAAMGLYAAEVKAEFSPRLQRGARSVLMLYPLTIILRVVLSRLLHIKANDLSPLFSVERCVLALGLLWISVQLMARLNHRFPHMTPRLQQWLIAFGRHSLLVYWVHVELAYGRIFRDHHGHLSPLRVTMATLIMIAAMMLLVKLRDQMGTLKSAVLSRFTTLST